MQATLSDRAQSPNITGILGNVGLKEDYMDQVGSFMSIRHSEGYKDRQASPV